ncbi:hypothetical protein E2C01_024730 [Portunus trituberculatus]|uniref:Uncharacterized protein n=1 Tax=Portunus trituberculatus TaxID=210409 RepID=A0A5B7EBJ8_PORTR|nr:hypothetical protein [Portunus trituberculatus]
MGSERTEDRGLVGLVGRVGRGRVPSLSGLVSIRNTPLIPAGSFPLRLCFQSLTAQSHDIISLAILSGDLEVMLMSGASRGLVKFQE